MTNQDFALYNIRRGPHGYQLGKFDKDLNLLAVYDTDTKYCTCPAGPRPTCRHRKMLPRMLAKVDTDSFYCYETNTWHRPLVGEAEQRRFNVPDASEASSSQSEVEAASEMLATPPSPEAAVMYANTELAPPVELAPAPPRPQATIRRR